jgi:HEAT repeat protein
MGRPRLVHLAIILCTCPPAWGADDADTKVKPPAYWIERLKSDNPFAVDAACAELRALGPRGKAVAPELIRALEGAVGETRERLVLALGQLGPVTSEVVPTLIRALKDPSRNVRRRAADALGAIASEPETTIPALIEALGDAEEWVQVCAAEALGQLGARASVATPKLLRLLEQPVLANQIDEPRTVVLALARIAPEPNRTLVGLLASPSFTVRSAAVEALEKMGAKARPALPEVLRLMRADPEEIVRGQAGEAAGAIAPGDPDVQKALFDLTRDREQYAREGAIKGLSLARPEAKRAIPRLIEIAVDDENYSCRDLAIQLLAEYGPVEAKPAVPAIIAALEEDPSEEVCKTAADALSRLGRGDAAVIAALIEAADDDDAGVRACVFLALTVADPEGKTVLPVLIRALKDMDGTGEAAALALGTMDPKAAAPAIPALIEALQRDGKVRPDSGALEAVADALALGTKDPKAAGPSIPALIEALRFRPASGALDEVAETLGEFGPAARAAVPRLRELALKSKSGSALFALTRIEPKGQATAQALESASRDENESVRAVAAGAMGRVTKEAERQASELMAWVNMMEAEEHPEYSLAGARSLSLLGPAAKAAVPALLEMRGKSRGPRRGMLTRIVLRIDPNAVVDR